MSDDLHSLHKRAVDLMERIDKAKAAEKRLETDGLKEVKVVSKGSGYSYRESDLAWSLTSTDPVFPVAAAFFQALARRQTNLLEEALRDVETKISVQLTQR
jgi:hypothetical protein